MARMRRDKPFIFWLIQKHRRERQEETADIHPMDFVQDLPGSIDDHTAGEVLTLEVVVEGGVTPYTYQWLRNGVMIAGATNSTYSETVINNSTFQCVITDSADQVLFSTICTVIPI